MSKQGPLPNLDHPVAPFVTKRVITDLYRTAPYLVRWSLWLPFGWSIKLHQILRADDDRCEHDHPWCFLRIILKGGYLEVVGADKRVAVRKPWRPWAPWRVYWCGPDFSHRILDLLSGTSWTLVICGPRMREWGFFTREGWMHWRSFVDAAIGKRVLWCDDGREISEERK